MKLTVTGVPKECVDGLIVVKLIGLEQVEVPEYVVVSINDELIRSDTFVEIVLKDGDNMEFLYLIDGGAA